MTYIFLSHLLVFKSFILQHERLLASQRNTLSLGYTSEKKNEWYEAIVLLTGMTTQAILGFIKWRHITSGLQFRVTYDPTTCDGRHELHNRYLGMQNRWNKFSRGIPLCI